MELAYKESIFTCKDNINHAFKDAIHTYKDCIFVYKDIVLVCKVCLQSLHAKKKYTIYLACKDDRLKGGYVNKKRIIDHQNFALLEYSTLEDGDSNWLIATFPNITNLVILHDIEGGFVNRLPEETNQLITLLHHWSVKLKSLKYFQLEYNIFEYNPALLDAINSMPALKRLWLVLNLDENFDQSQIDLPVLAQLDQFYVDSLFEKLSISAICSIQKYASVMNSNLKIAIHGSIDDENMLEKFCQFNHQLAKRFVECDFEFNFDINSMQNFYLKFTLLTNVSLNMNNVSLSHLCLCLTPLENLNHLVLFSSYAASVNFSAEDQLLSSNFPPLPSVRALDMRITLKSHLALNSIHLPAIFPNVELVYVNKEVGRCSICDIEYKWYPTMKNLTNKRYRSCFQKLVKSFRMLPKVVKIIDHYFEV